MKHLVCLGLALGLAAALVCEDRPSCDGCVAKRFDKNWLSCKPWGPKKCKTKDNTPKWDTVYCADACEEFPGCDCVGEKANGGRKCLAARDEAQCDRKGRGKWTTSWCASTDPPTAEPTTLDPTAEPTAKPTANPTAEPTTLDPTAEPTAKPTANPTAEPTTLDPTAEPTAKPTAEPTAEPTTLDPTAEPTVMPTANPTAGPTAATTPPPSVTPDTRSLEEALVRDFFDTLPSSDSCAGVGGTFSSTFTHSASTSTWADESLAYEPKVFLAELSHTDPDPDKSWKIRIGHGGNMYSFIGPFGESVPPQKHDGAPFIDEVWQSVAVDLGQNSVAVVPACEADDGQNCAAPFYIHQAGAYQENRFNESPDKYPYPELEDQPNYSPNVAKYCDSVGRTCGFVSWGQQAHLPTPFKSNVLYYTRYRDCGGGVLEVTSGMHNSVKSQDRIDYTNLPWGGVRTSTLSSVTFADISGTSELDDPLWDDTEEYIPLLDTLGGYTTFLEAYPIASSDVTPSGVTMQYNGWSASRTTSLGFEVFFRFDATTTFQSGSSGPLEIRNQDGVVEEIASVRHWAWPTGPYHTCYYVATDEQGLVRFRDKFSDDDVLTFWTPSGKPYEENKALSVVHGRSLDAPDDRLRVWSSQRDYTVWTVNGRMRPPWSQATTWRDPLDGGGSISSRQFFVTGPYLGSYSSSRPLVEEAGIEHEMPHTGTLSPVGLFAAEGGSIVGAGLINSCAATPRCTGYSAPGAGRAPLFAITCGATHYVGDDLYHFEGAGLYSWDKVPWRCAGEATTVRPTWTLLGYFDATDCQDVAAHEYVAGYCPP